MKNLKTIFLTSFITILIVSVIFAYFYSQKSETINSSTNIDSLNTESNSALVESSSILPVNLRQQNNNQISNSRENILTNTVKKVSPAIVGINVIETRYYRDPNPFFRQFFGDRIYKKDFPGLGSGYIVSSDGYILTNDHVAGDASKIIVTLTNGSQYDAELIGTDPATDIALLKIDEQNLPYLKLGSSEDLLIGEWVLALGNPYGLFAYNNKPTVTLGVISSLYMNLGAINEHYYLNMIQTDASINGGNSGGPLVNSLGEVIGMNTIIITETKGSIGLGFAIPINLVKTIYQELKNNGKVDRNFWTGLSIHSIDEGIANYYKLENKFGVIVTNVQDNSPASQAGLEPGDIILQVNNIIVNSEETMVSLFKQAKTEQQLDLRVVRDKKTTNVKLTLEAYND